jgi:hypothetical protein
MISRGGAIGVLLLLLLVGFVLFIQPGGGGEGSLALPNLAQVDSGLIGLVSWLEQVGERLALLALVIGGLLMIIPWGGVHLHGHHIVTRAGICLVLLVIGVPFLIWLLPHLAGGVTTFLDRATTGRGR